ncbi:MAG: histidine kinase [Rikenellaceae bacterium]|nr:histidine kinase [Rikenellaceae bacterium]
MKRTIPSSPYQFNRSRAFQSSVIVSLVLNSTMVLGVLYGHYRSFLDEAIDVNVYVTFFLWHCCFNILLFYILFLYNFYIIRSRKIQRNRRLYIVIGVMLLPAALSSLLSALQWKVLGGTPDDPSKGAFMLFNILKDVMASMIVLMLTVNMYLNHKREQMITANQKLREENIRTRYEALKNQLDPHFLFNSLNTLNGLIGMDDEKAHEYIDNMSSIFRYTLHSKSIGTLDEEIEFVEAYLSMLKIRFGENLQIYYSISNRYRKYHIMPASLQLLVENAVKHNVISAKNPLAIAIKTTDRDSVLVSNRITPKREKSIGGVGLANLIDRYWILFEKRIGVSDQNGVFSVELPLINDMDKRRNL